MRLGVCWAALAAVLLGACGRERPPVTTVLDEVVPLVRGAHVDLAQREIAVEGDSIVVAIVNEEQTDVRLKISPAGEDDTNTAVGVEVENNLEGSGIEIATLRVADASRITLTLTGPQDLREPGSVRLRVNVYPVDAAKSGRNANLIRGFEHWSVATIATRRVDTIKTVGLENIDAAIQDFEAASGGDSWFAANARLVEANMLYAFGVDWRKARWAAHRAAEAFILLPKPDVLNQARAHYLEALALTEIANDAQSKNPTSEQANQLASEILRTLSREGSAFGPIERARALIALGIIDINVVKLDDADQRIAESQSIYHAGGSVVGVLESRVWLANVLLERGRFYDAAQAYDRLLPELDRITNPDRRIAAYYHAGRAQAFSGRPDDAAENMLKALALARQYKVRLLEGRVMQGLGHLYQNQADPLQARAFFAEGLKILREANDPMALVWALGNYGGIARADGDYPLAIELHKEAVRRSANPIGVVRSLRELGLDYQAVGDGPAAIAAFRESLAVKLQDPKHRAYSDVRRNLAQALIEFGDGSRQTRDEAAALLAVTLDDCIRVHDELGELGARRVHAQLLAVEGKDAAARAEYERVFAVARAYRAKSANTELHAGTLAHEQAAFRGYLDLVLARVAARGPQKLEPASAAEISALHTLELARDAHFGSTRTGTLDAETTQRVDALLEQMATKSVRMAALFKQKVDPAEAAELETLQLDMSGLRAELESVRTAAAAKRAASEKARPPAPRAWRDLAPSVVQLSYALGQKQVYVWVRTGSGIRVSVLAQGPGELEKQLTELGSLNPQSEPVKIEQALDRVSALLLPDGMLPAHSNEIEIVAEGRIAGVAFPGLRSPLDRSRHLIETHNVTMISSMFAAGDSSRTQSRPFQLVALASGNGALRSARQPDSTPRLQAATKEIRDVAALFEGSTPGAKVKLLIGAEGNSVNLRGIWSSGVDVVHFATHALADLQQPLASLLVMPATGADGTATYLTAGQVRDWRGDADLVFLSACDSAIGPPRFASGMPGLQHAFLRAGARGVIATLWPIEDVLAQEFSADFYKRFTGGLSAVQALRETQRAWLADEAGRDPDTQARRRITALAHAYYTR